MRIAYLPTIVSAAMLLGAFPATAQQQAEPTVEGYLCTFAGKCGDAPEAKQPTRAAPATRGFRIARAKPEASTAPARATGRTASAAYPSRSGPIATSWRRPLPGASRFDATISRPADAPRADLMISFDLNSARITRDGIAKAQIFARSLQMAELRGKRFLIEGHTDSLGGVPFNMELSRRRAAAVADYLAQQGVERSRVEVRGFGPSIPLPGRRTTDPRNRRVEAKLIS
jgi:outer membrane protein OmpA-like peptidoglycan-associated protein